MPDLELPRADVAAIVLAGGRATRFGADKLVTEVGGRALVLHAIDAARAVAQRIVVVDEGIGELRRIGIESDADQGIGLAPAV